VILFYFIWLTCKCL